MAALEKKCLAVILQRCALFLGRNKADSCENLVETLLQTYCKLGRRMSLKMHNLHSPMDFSNQI